MDFTNSHRINDRLLMGHFPDCQIRIDLKREVLISDINKKERKGHSIIKKYSLPLHLALQIYLNQFNAVLNEYGDEVLAQEFNFLINTLINPETVSVDNEFVQQAIQQFPAVTVFDKALWGAVLDSYSLALVDDKDWLCVSYAWIRLLRTVQQKEIKYKKTIDLSLINETTPLLDILYRSWDDISAPCFTEITANEYTSLEKLSAEQERLRETCLALVENGDHIAERTDTAWKQFIDILNDIQVKESHVATQICSPISATEKIKAIAEYNYAINQLQKGTVVLHNEVIALDPMFVAIEERLKKAPAHCFVSDCDGASFRLCIEAIHLLRNPTTFNYLFIAYHHFRLDPTQNNALSFLKLALVSLKNNLLEDNIVKEDSIEIIAQSFYNMAKRFWQENQPAISQLSFDKVQHDAIINGESSAKALLINRLRSRMYVAAKETILELDDSLCTTESLKNTQTLVSQFIANYYRKLGVDGNNLDLYFESQFDQEFARLLVISLNIIYLFCDALKILSDDSGCHSFIDDLDLIDECREDLQDIHTSIARMVYTKNVKLGKYRRATGIDADAITKQEHRAEEQFQRDTFVSLLSRYLSGLNVSIHKRSIEELLDVNRRFRAEILRCPIFIDEEDHMEDLEKVSNEICNSLIEVFEAESPERMTKEKQAILSELSIEEKVLPELTIKALATAELLFHKYANKKYQREGFDYSSISALYYQAFEHAYNSLIWQRYVVYLDSVRIDGNNLAEYLYRSYTSVEQKGIIEDPRVLEYLPKKGIEKYIKKPKSNQPVCFHPTITYEIFHNLISDISGKRKLNKFCDFFSELTGFSNRQAMLEDTIFMGHVKRFANKINRKTENRNMASHGGNEINFRMCSDDKKAVLFDLEAVREDSISLIQLLLYIVSYNKSLPQCDN